MMINVAVNKRLISEERARSIAKRRFRGVDPSKIDLTLCYKKMYFSKMLALCARTPFPPKKRPYVVFFDAYLQVGGATYDVPAAEEKEIAPELILRDRTNRHMFEKQEDSLIERYVLKQYLLKRPDIKKEGISEIYLPYYRAKAKGLGKEEFVNAATGKFSL